MKRTILLALAALTLTACSPSEPSEPSAPIQPIEKELRSEGDMLVGHAKVTVFHDEKHGVVCWLYNGYTEAGLSCLPEDQVKGN